MTRSQVQKFKSSKVQKFKSSTGEQGVSDQEVNESKVTPNQA